MASTLFILSILCLSGFSFSEAQEGGFSVELIHRDSPKSPFYNPYETPYQRVTKALRRSINNLNRFDSTQVSPNLAEADIISDAGEYLMNISIGSPPVAILGIADTGSDLVWTQCKPCTDCFEQKAPLFEPNSSSTYRDVSCSSSQCSSLDRSSCDDRQSCLYSVAYGDRSFSNGNLAVDTITLGSTTGRPVALPKSIFGCGHNNDGTFSSETSGIVGLGGGDVSLITQMGSSIEGKFSYCLIPFGSRTANVSKLNFGTKATVSGTGTVSTPLVAKEPKTFYFLTLESISVADKTIPFEGSTFGTSEGNIIIDSGTTLTILPEQFASELHSAISGTIDAKPVSDPQGFLDLCYKATDDFKVPEIIVKFKGGDVKLNPINLFIAVSEDIVCSTFKGSQDTAIYGNLHQMDFLVGYNTKEQTVSFKPTDCTKL
ncbi:hypothetical protein ACOSP7_014261 [Xanthoceras sorbifolium]|uniref:Peptidase A1 domain-containing protein n=1 Tax=Xanthoceras sorbifolium TaxID=99658 RepID=A0ABQ8I4L8_9ROSI|nr:hypothetical protein JRO89_XS04G0083000 [Xanthoceras sorbifolium]